MLSIKRLFWLLAITISISIVFVLYNINENTAHEVEAINEIQESAELISVETEQLSDTVLFYIIGKEDDVLCNTKNLFDSLHLTFQITDYMEEQNMMENTVLIFCDDTISDYADLKALGTYIEQGGKVLLAGGLAEGTKDTYLQPFLGIIEKSSKQNYNEFTITESFLPFSDSVVTYSGFNASTWIKTRKDAEIYLSDTDSGVPVIYGYSYGKGKSVIINASFLEDEMCNGMLCGALGELLGEFTYPVLGVKCFFMDNFPFTTSVNDKASMSLYGRTTGAFISDIVWPEFQGIMIRNHFRPTTGVLTVSTEEKSFPELNRKTFFTIGKDILQIEGELIYLADASEENRLYYNTNFMDYFSNTFTNYSVYGMAMQKGSVSGARLEELKEVYPDLRVIRTNLKENTEESAAFGESENGIYIFPVFSRGFDRKEGADFLIASGLAAYGVFSHSVDMNLLVPENDTQQTWEKAKVNLEELEEDVLSKLDWLTSTTLSQTRNNIESYHSLEYQWKATKDELMICCNDFLKGQPFYVRTDQSIVSVDGAGYERINDFYYILHIEQPVVKIRLEE